MNNEAMSILPRFSRASIAELEAHHVPQNVITFVEQNREHLQRAVQTINASSMESMGVQIPDSISGAGAQHHIMPVSMNPTAMSGVRSSSFFTLSAGYSQIRCPTQEDLNGARRWIEEKKRMAFSGGQSRLLRLPRL